MNTTSTTEQAVAAVEADQGLFVTVPETMLPGGHVEPAFMVAKYLLSRGVDSKPTLDAAGAPWVNISYHDARQACADFGGSMITETQALSLAHNLAQVARNWIGGVVGAGNMCQGLRLDLDDVDEPYAFDFVSPDETERREFYLADGQMILDVAGNAYTWVFDNVQGDENGIVALSFAADSPSIATAPYPSMEKGMGWRPGAGTDWSGDALVRGGCWCSGSGAGVFSLGNGWPGDDFDLVGVRCTKPVGL